MGVMLDQRGVGNSYFPRIDTENSSFHGINSIGYSMAARHIGVDEAGRGPCIGPLVVSALNIPERDRSILRDLGVDDSKNLSKMNRERLYKEILSFSESLDWTIGIVLCDARRIDNWMDGGSLNTLEVLLFSEAIGDAAEPEGSVDIFLDACDVDEERFGRMVSETLGDNWDHCKIYSEHKMDSRDEVVAAASVIAKVSRDLAMEDLSRELNIDLGSGYPSDPKTREALEILCEKEVLSDCVRRNWANVKRTWDRIHNRPLQTRADERTGVFQSALDEWE